MGQPPLARERVRHVGDPIAVVVAETASPAVDAAEQIWVDVNALPAVTDPEAALEDDVILFPAAGTNLVFDRTTGSHGPLPQVQAETMVEVDIPRVSPVTIEPWRSWPGPKAGISRCGAATRPPGGWPVSWETSST